MNEDEYENELKRINKEAEQEIKEIKREAEQENNRIRRNNRIYDDFGVICMLTVMLFGGAYTHIKVKSVQKEVSQVLSNLIYIEYKMSTVINKIDCIGDDLEIIKRRV